MRTIRPVLLMCCALLVPVARGAPVDVASTNQMQLGLKGDFYLSGAAPLRFRAVGPGKLYVQVLSPGEAPVAVEVKSGKETVLRETVALEPVSVMSGRVGRTSFEGRGFKRLTLDLPPSLRVYEVKVEAGVAVAVLRRPQLPTGKRVRETPVKAEGRLKSFTVRAEEPWHWGSVCDRVTVRVPSPGTLKVRTRMQLDSYGDLPPPSFLRVVDQGKVLFTGPITASSEPGFEFASGRIRYTAGTMKALSVFAPQAGDLDVELAAWGCINGVGLQFDFVPGGKAPAVAAAPNLATVSASASAEKPPEKAPPAPAPSTVEPEKAVKQGDELAQCMLMVEDLTRERVAEYLDTMMASGVIPSARLTVRERSALGESFVFHSAAYTLDGLPLFSHERAQVDGSAVVLRQVVPGLHTLEVKVTLKGRGAGQFRHLNDTVYRVSRKETFVAEAGKRYTVRVTFEDRGGFATPMKDRAGVGLAVVPEG